jgi:hypothetical protein
VPGSTPSIAWHHATGKERDAIVALTAALESETLPPNLDPLFRAFGGRDRGMLCYLRAGDVNFDLRLAVSRLKATAAFRQELGLDSPTLDVMREIESHPLRAHWPASFPMIAPDGCPVLFCRAGLIRPKQLAKAGDDALSYLLTIWFLHALHLQAKTQATRMCKGTVDIYDCSHLSISVLSEWGALRTLKKCVGLAQAHFPENLSRCFVINAPRAIAMVWTAVRPLLNERTRHKITISAGVPESLAEALGGQEHLQAVLDSVPDPKAKSR